MFRRRYILLIVTAELQTSNVAYFQRKIQLSGFSVYTDGSPSKLIRTSEVVLYVNILKMSQREGHIATDGQSGGQSLLVSGHLRAA